MARNGQPTGLKRAPQPSADPPGQEGLVLAHYGQTSLVETRHGDLIRCSTRRSLPRTVCGDHVLWQEKSSGNSVITRTRPRESVLLRPDQQGRERPVAANFDQIVIVIATRPSFEYTMLDRYLVAAELMGADPLVVVNKSDLLGDNGRHRLLDRLSVYRHIGYRPVFTSTRSTDGMKELHGHLRGRTSILLGQSGVGKSSIVQALLPDIDVRVGRLSKVTGLGRHTTTVAMLYHLPDGGDLIDSPGVRDFQPGVLAEGRLAEGFAEFRAFIGQCRFNDCRHTGEPGCAIQDAVRHGKIDAARLESYRGLLGSRRPGN